MNCYCRPACGECRSRNAVEIFRERRARNTDINRAGKARRAETAVDVESQSNGTSARGVCGHIINDRAADGLTVCNRVVADSIAADDL